MHQDEKIKQIHIRLDSNLHQALKLEAALCSQTIQELVVEIITQRLSTSEFSRLLIEGQ
jgi:predicted HicB family RNase H-like nuclease